MRIVAISDTHEQHQKLGKLPDGDVLVHCGDLSGNGSPFRLQLAATWLRDQPHRHKVVVAGNHDLTLQSDPESARELFKGLIYLDRTAYMIEGLKFYGTPWSPYFLDWAFNATPEQQIQHAREIPHCDVLISHGPPFQCGDRCEDGREVGCPHLRARILEIKPKLVLTGHIHEGYGVRDMEGVKVVNASVLDENYKQVNAPIVVDL